MHSAEDWAAFAVWAGGGLVRSMSISPGDGVLEDEGDRLPCEGAFWEGDHPVRHAPEYPLPFHPLELGNAVLRECFGFVLEGHEGPDCFDPEDAELLAFTADKV